MNKLFLNDNPEIGGYFQLEQYNKTFLHDDAILLGSGRQCLEYVLTSNTVKKIFVPRYTCNAVHEPINKLSILKEFYEVDNNFEIVSIPILKSDEYLLYTNYFGIKDDYISFLVDCYGRNLIVDSSQAYYSGPWIKSHTFYSPRKFFGIPDGGCLYSDSKIKKKLNTSKSYLHCSHLLKRVDIGAKAGYKDYKNNEVALSGKEIEIMSELTKTLLSNINYEFCANQRISNFKYLDDALNVHNEIKTFDISRSVPMVYPFKTSLYDIRMYLIRKNIFVPLYWPNVLKDCEVNSKSYELSSKIIPLPIDQRYGFEEMNIIIEAIFEYLH